MVIAANNRSLLAAASSRNRLSKNVPPFNNAARLRRVNIQTFIPDGFWNNITEF
jgi:hypothetical protein